MPRRPAVARTSITLPPGELSAADRLAAALDRSRSWVFAEAIRRWAGGVPSQEAAPPTPLPPVATPPRPALPRPQDPAAALRLTPLARLQRSQELTAGFRRSHPRSGRIQIIAFGSEGDFLEWKGPA